jgi:Protein of unknown function (DUF2934)
MATSNTTPSGTRRRTQPAVVISRDEIAHRAYEFYLARGSEHGRDLDDWLRAERELQPKLLQRAS